MEWVEPVRVQPQEIVLPIKEETVDAVMLVPSERVQRRTAEKIGDVPQFRKEPEEVVEAVTSVPRERVQQRTAGQDRRLQRAVEQAVVDLAEAEKFCPSETVW